MPRQVLSKSARVFKTDPLQRCTLAFAFQRFSVLVFLLQTCYAESTVKNLHVFPTGNLEVCFVALCIDLPNEFI